MLRVLVRLIRSRGGRRPRPRPGRPRLECLEDRAVPAGNVLATQAGAAITLVGDDLGNAVQLRTGGLPGEVVVLGVNTTVNGARQQVFTGVARIDADLRGGDDRFKADGLALAAAAGASLVVDGGPGDDRIELTDTSVRADGGPTGGAIVQVYGERVGPGSPPTTGNDTIRLTGTTVASDGPFSNSAFLGVYGERNEGGTVTGGNDTIAVTDTVITAGRSLSENDVASLEVYGDYNAGTGKQASTIGGGDDTITVSGTTVVSGGDSADFASLTIYGDLNAASGDAPGGTTAATIGGGNDTITVTDSAVSATGGGFADVANLTIFGDRNSAVGYFPGTTTAATVGGGDDTIRVAGTAVGAVGGLIVTTAGVDITGDYSNVFNSPAGTTAVVGGGNDAIAVTGASVSVTGPEGGFNFAGLSVTGENTADPGSTGGGVVGGGGDEVALRGVSVTGDIAVTVIDTGIGDDRLSVTDSAPAFFFAALGDGDDEVKLNANTFTSASLDGGPGHDRLSAHDNTGTLVWVDFEEVNATP